MLLVTYIYVTIYILAIFSQSIMYEYATLLDNVIHTLLRRHSRMNVSCSVADPWHLGLAPDPDPRIHASD